MSMPAYHPGTAGTMNGYRPMSTGYEPTAMMHSGAPMTYASAAQHPGYALPAHTGAPMTYASAPQHSGYAHMAAPVTTSSMYGAASTTPMYGSSHVVSGVPRMATLPPTYNPAPSMLASSHVVAGMPPRPMQGAYTSSLAGSNASWNALAEAGPKDKKGWMVWNNQVLLRQAAKKYGKPITLEHGQSVPFNECAEWFEPGGEDHWFELDLNTDEMIAELGEQITGQLFTTRMPRSLDEPGTKGATNKARFLKKCKDNNIKKVFTLVEDKEPAEYKSKDLFEFYKHDCKMEVFRRPVEDYNCPSFEIEDATIADIDIALKLGENCLVHCLGGSGRTGTVIIGALQNLGVVDAIGFARKVKSVYLDIKEQEEFLNKQKTIVTESMVHKCPALAKDIVMIHIKRLTEASALVDISQKIKDTELKALKSIFDMAAPRSGFLGMHHTDHISVNELLSLRVRSELAPAAKIDPTALLHLLGQLGVPQAAVDEKVISFDVFLMLLQLNPQEDHADYEAKTRAVCLAKK